MEMVITLEGKYMNPNIILLFGEKVYCFVWSAEICGNTCVLPIVLKSRAVFPPGVNRAQVLGTYTV